MKIIPRQCTILVLILFCLIVACNSKSQAKKPIPCIDNFIAINDSNYLDFLYSSIPIKNRRQLKPYLTKQNRSLYLKEYNNQKSKFYKKEGVLISPNYTADILANKGPQNTWFNLVVFNKSGKTTEYHFAKCGNESSVLYSAYIDCDTLMHQIIIDEKGSKYCSVKIE